jgi:hypothetical protein
MKLRHERGRRLAVNLLRRTDLPRESARAHHRDPVGDRQRLLLVVRHVDGGDAELLLQLADLAAHLDAQLGVEVGERLVEQQHLGSITRQRAIATRCSCPPESWCGQRSS